MEFAKKWHVVTDESTGDVSVGCESISFDDKVYQIIESGIGSVTAIAKELTVAASTVSKACKRLCDAHRIRKNGRNFVASVVD